MSIHFSGVLLLTCLLVCDTGGSDLTPTCRDKVGGSNGSGWNSFVASVQRNNNNNPELVLSTNVLEGGSLYRGWPLLVRLSVRHSRLFAAKGAPVHPYKILAQEGPWTNALTLTVSDQNGEQVVWSVQLLMQGEDQLTIDRVTSGEVAWLVPPEISSELKPGLYSIAVSIDTRKSVRVEGWKGYVISNAVDLSLSEEPEILSEAMATRKSMEFAGCRFAQARYDESLSILDSILMSDMSHIPAAVLKVKVLDAQGKLLEALALLEDLIMKDGKEMSNNPPVLLMDLHRKLVAKGFLNEVP
jgi:hypothetical protein